MAVRSPVRRRLVALGLAALVIGGAAATAPAAGAPAAPPNDTFEITITSGAVVAPGGTISFVGTCWSSALNAAQFGYVRAHLVVGPGVQPFMFGRIVSVNPSTGAVSATITVPGEAPNGSYEIGLSCHTQDQWLGVGEQPFTVDGPQITTTTTTSTTTTTTSTSSVPAPVPASVPARPLSTTAEFTG